MNNGFSYPSCIKIPPSNAKQSISSPVPQKCDLKETIAFNSELISLANRVFGEGKWSHTVTNQTIDFIEAFMGKYICGCATFVKIQLQDGIHHEDIGYCHVEGAIKGLAIHCARMGSLTDALERVLLCFGKEMEVGIRKIVKKFPSLQTPTKQKDEVHCMSFNEPTNMLEPCAQSTPFITHKSNEQNKLDNVSKMKTLDEQLSPVYLQPTTVRPKSPVEQRQSVSTKAVNNSKSSTNTNNPNPLEKQENISREQEPKEVLAEEEILRMERKRRQMEKQAEFKRKMREKELQKTNENKKPNPKY